MISMAEEYSTLRIAVDRAIKDIETNDLIVNFVEVHGPHSGFRIANKGVNGPWISTPIEK